MELHDLAAEWATDQMIKLFRGAHLIKTRQDGDLQMAEKIQPGRSKEESRCHCTAIRKASRRISQLYDAALAPSGL